MTCPIPTKPHIILWLTHVTLTRSRQVSHHTLARSRHTLPLPHNDHPSPHTMPCPIISSTSLQSIQPTSPRSLTGALGHSLVANHPTRPTSRGDTRGAYWGGRLPSPNCPNARAPLNPPHTSRGDNGTGHAWSEGYGMLGLRAGDGVSLTLRPAPPSDMLGLRAGHGVKATAYLVAHIV